MKKRILIIVAFAMACLANAQISNPLVGMWQQVVNVNQTTVTIGPNGKVFLPDGRIFGYFLNPSEFETYSNYNFGPWLFGNYEVTSDSTYTENIFLHQTSGWEGKIDFDYTIMNNHALLTQYVHTYPDNSQRTFTELWIKMVKGEKEQNDILEMVKAKWDEYLDRGKILFGRKD